MLVFKADFHSSEHPLRLSAEGTQRSRSLVPADETVELRSVRVLEG